MKESELQREIIKYLRLRRCEVFKVNSGGVYDPVRHIFRTNPYKGVSDIIACSPQGRFIAIEVKTKTKTSKEQRDFLFQIQRRGGIAILAHSLNDVINAI